ncbi:MAG: putative membrane protein, partial [Glaciecola sp.]
MSQNVEQASETKIEKSKENAIENSGIARVIPSAKLDKFACFNWIALGIKDFKRAKVISLFYGFIFTLIPVGIYFLVKAASGFYLVIFPAMICFMLLGPYLAAGLYDVSWQFEKQRKPSLRHSLKAMSRNAVNEWAFGIMLMVLMIFWLRVASIIHALYPSYLDPTFFNIWPFLTLGT